MTKIVHIIRHAKLAAPYTQYMRLTFSQLCQLSTQQINPVIHPRSQQAIAKTLAHPEMQAIELILCSQAERTLQTAQLFAKNVGRSLPIKQTALLNEMCFDPAQFSSAAAYAQKKMRGIRQGVFKGMLAPDHQGVEPIAQIYARMQLLQSLLDEQPQQHILCISHGFYMRALHLYFVQQSTAPANIALRDLQHAPNYPNLAGFSIPTVWFSSSLDDQQESDLETHQELLLESSDRTSFLILLHSKDISL